MDPARRVDASASSTDARLAVDPENRTRWLGGLGALCPHVGYRTDEGEIAGLLCRTGLCRTRKMSEPERILELADDYLAAAEVVSPRYRGVLLDIVERYCEIELGGLPAHVRNAVRRLRTKGSTVN